MSRTKGSGWGDGKPINWQTCPKCNKKRAYMRYFLDIPGVRLHCTLCKERFN